jgi:hypothetical protein
MKLFGSQVDITPTWRRVKTIHRYNEPNRCYNEIKLATSDVDVSQSSTLVDFHLRDNPLSGLQQVLNIFTAVSKTMGAQLVQTLAGNLQVRQGATNP